MQTSSVPAPPRAFHPDEPVVAPSRSQAASVYTCDVYSKILKRRECNHQESMPQACPILHRPPPLRPAIGKVSASIDGLRTFVNVTQPGESSVEYTCIRILLA